MLSGASWEMLGGGQPAVCGTLVLPSTLAGVMVILDTIKSSGCLVLALHSSGHA